MGRLLVSTKGIEHLHPRPPKSEGEKDTASQTQGGTDSDMGADLTSRTGQCLTIGVMQVMLEVLLGQRTDLLACVFAEYG